jgi:hypothetical protein
MTEEEEGREDVVEGGATAFERCVPAPRALDDDEEDV